MVGWKVYIGPGWEIRKDGWLGIFDWTPAGGIQKGAWLEIWNGTRMGKSEDFLVVNPEGEALGGADGMWSGGPK